MAFDRNGGGKRPQTGGFDKFRNNKPQRDGGFVKRDAGYKSAPKRDYSARPIAQFDDAPGIGAERTERRSDDHTSFGQRGNNSGSSRPARSYSDKPAYQGGERPARSFGDKPAFKGGDRPARSFGDKPAFKGGDRPAYGQRDNKFGDRPARSFEDRPARSFGDKPAYQGGNRPTYGQRDNKFGGDRPARSFEDRPARSFGDKPAYQGGADRPARSFGDKPAYQGGDRPARSFGDKPAYQGADRPARSFGDKPAYQGGDRPARSYDDKPAYQGGDRLARSFGDKPAYQGGDRPARSFGDKPAYQGGDRSARSFGDKPAYQGGDRPAYGQRDNKFGGDRPARSFEDRPAKSFGDRPAFKPNNTFKPARPEYTDKPMPHAIMDEPAFEKPTTMSSHEIVLDENAMPENMLVGRNPIREAIKAGGDIEKILVAKGELTGSAKEIIAKAREARIIVQEVDRSRLDVIYRNHQGMIAFASAAKYSTVEEILEVANDKGEPPFIIILDSVTDPHNLGAVIRSAECAGAHGVIVPERRAVGLTPAAVKSSAGAIEYVKVARVVNLNRTLEELKAKGVWIIGADSTGNDYRKVDLTGPIALVIGSEGEGISKLTLEKCDSLVSIPLKGSIDSLNASVAASILMYKVLDSREV